MKRFIAIWILASAGLNIWQCVHIKNLEKSALWLSINRIIKVPKLKAESSKKGDTANYTR